MLAILGFWFIYLSVNTAHRPLDICSVQITVWKALIDRVKNNTDIIENHLPKDYRDNHCDLDSRLKEILKTSGSVLDIRTDFEI